MGSDYLWKTAWFAHHYKMGVGPMWRISRHACDSTKVKDYTPLSLLVGMHDSRLALDDCNISPLWVLHPQDTPFTVMLRFYRDYRLSLKLLLS